MLAHENFATNAPARDGGDSMQEQQTLGQRPTMAVVNPIIRLHEADNVVVARVTLLPGTSVRLVDGGPADSAGAQGRGPQDRAGEPVRKYDQIIGFATAAIAPGEHVHVQNLGMGDFAKDHAYGADAKPTDAVPQPATFEGIASYGRVATRNYIGILTSVNCSAHTASLIADAFRRNPFTGYEPLAEFPNVDGVVALTHKTGCGMAARGGIQLLRRTLAGYARHPNFSHVIVLGLGCEVNQISELLREHRLSDRSATWISRAWAASARPWRPGSPSCGGCLGVQPGQPADRSGSSPQSRPAMWWLGRVFRGFSKPGARRRQRSRGAERRHRDPCRDDRDVWCRAPFHASRGQPRSWRKARRPHAVVEEYTHKHGEEINANPSPGNKAGGLTTIIEKSLGAMAKAGSTNLVDVVKYAEPVTQKGFVCMDTPGFDPVAATGQVAGGANSSASPPAAAACSAANPRRRSRSRPIRLCFSAWRRTWTSTAAQSWMAMRRCRGWTAHLRAHPAGRLGRTEQERAIRCRF